MVDNWQTCLQDHHAASKLGAVPGLPVTVFSATSVDNVPYLAGLVPADSDKIVHPKASPTFHAQIDKTQVVPRFREFEAQFNCNSEFQNHSQNHSQNCNWIEPIPRMIDSEFGIWALQLKGPAQTTNLRIIPELSISEWFSESIWDLLWSIQLQFWEWFWE